MKKSISILLCMVLLMGLLAACGGSYRDDASISELEAAIDSSIGGAGSMIKAPDSYISFPIQIEASDYAEACIKVDSQGININEYGVFKTTGKDQAAALKTKLEESLAHRVETWMPEYMPEELPKLENAVVTVCGNYVMYAILDSDGRTAAANAFENTLKG